MREVTRARTAAAAATVLAAAAWLRPEGVLGRRSICPIAHLTGHPCPGCGMTRGLILLLHGRVREAHRMNARVCLVAAALVALVIAPFVRPGALGQGQSEVAMRARSRSA